MEFPNLGEQCSASFCRTLDFLPVRCSGCQKVFCKDHYKFESHSCPVGNPSNRQVPVCPLCGTPVPTGPNESADVKVGQHIDESCQSQPSRVLKGKIFKNSCSVPGCKKKELVPIRCSRCQLNYCLSHRNEMDHNCQGRRMSKRMNSAGAAAVRRAVAMQQSNSKTENNNSATLSKAQQELEDRDLALALALSLETEENSRSQRQQFPTSSESSCNVS
nr:zinc finger AN1 type domain 2B [Hymenolepis microstoma]